jgi:hypothetical protein
MATGTAEFAVFGQEFYFEESIRAIEALADASESGRPAERIAELLPHPSQETRLRVASKIAQRFFRPPDGRISAVPFLRLVKGTKDESSRRYLLYWRTARTDQVIAAIAGDIFYPYFVLNTTPSGFDEAAFNQANTGTLLTVDRIISRDFVAEYSERIWRLESARTLTLALRIMRQAEILDAVSMNIAGRRVLGYYPMPSCIRPEIFAYCMCEELFAGPEAVPMPSLDQVQNGDCAKLFLLSRLHVDSLLKSLDRKKLIEIVSLPGGRYIRAMSPDALVDRLLQAM